MRNISFRYDLDDLLRQPSPDPGASPGSGPIQRWLLDPGGFNRHLLTGTRAHLEQLWATGRPVILTGLALALAFSLLWWRVQARVWRRARANARWVEVVPPPQTEPGAGPAMWRQVTGLLRPGALGARRRLLTWELHAGHERLHAGLWVPDTIHPAHVSRAVTGAYPRAVIIVSEPGEDLAPPLPPPRLAAVDRWYRVRALIAQWWGRTRPARRPASAGYLLVPQTSMWLPLLAESVSRTGRSGVRISRTRSVTGGAADPLAMLCLGLAETPPGYRAIVQVLARPLPAGTRSAARRVRRSGGAPPGPGLPARGVLGILQLVAAGIVALLDVFTPGPASTSARSGGASTVHGNGEGLDPVTREQRRAAASKAAAELVEICVRVVVSGPNRRRCREQAWVAANSLRAVITAQGSDTVRLPHPEPTVTVRAASNWRATGFRVARAGHRRGWFVATDAEVGALARLPYQPALYRFDVARAPHLAAPTGIPRIRAAVQAATKQVDLWSVEEPGAEETAPVRPLPVVAPLVDDLTAEADDLTDVGDTPVADRRWRTEATDPDEGEQAAEGAQEEWAFGGYGWDEDFPELGWAEDGDPEDGYGPEDRYGPEDGFDSDGGYRGEAA